MMEEAYAFMDLYAKAKVLVLGGGSNPGLEAVFMDSAQIAVTTRPMTVEEKERASSGGFQVHEFKIAKDGIAIVVNPSNPVEKLTVTQVAEIFTGRMKDWSEVGGKSGSIRVCIWNENSGTYTFFRDGILKIDQYTDRAWRFDNTEEMIKNIEKEHGAIGLISMAHLYRSWNPLIEETRIKPLAIGQSPQGEFVLPDEATVHDSTYPFIRNIYLYTSHEPKGLANGFITFLTSSAGQKIIAGNGFVPVTVPVKYKKGSL